MAIIDFVKKTKALNIGEAFDEYISEMYPGMKLEWKTYQALRHAFVAGLSTLYAAQCAVDEMPLSGPDKIRLLKSFYVEIDKEIESYDSMPDELDADKEHSFVSK